MFLWIDLSTYIYIYIYIYMCVNWLYVIDNVEGTLYGMIEYRII